MIHEKNKIDYSTGEVKLVNTNFTQLYDDNVDLIIEIANESPTAVKIFLFLIKHMDNRNALVISQQALSEALNIHRATVHRAVDYLKDKKALEILKSGNSNVYAINSEIAWKAGADRKEYAHFTAKVYISASEQETPTFKTESFGHAIKKRKTKKPKSNSKKTIEKFESETLNHPVEVDSFIKKGYKYIGETDNAYELKDENGTLIIVEK